MQQRVDPIVPQMTIAVFDLDGTLTTRDTLLPFLITYARRHRRITPLLALPFELAGFLCRLTSGAVAKERLLCRFLAGGSEADIRRHAEWFCEHWLVRHLRPLAMDRLREHQVAGHRVILLSASPSVYVPNIADHLGISETVCTTVQVTNGVCTGRIEGDNCRGETKCRMLAVYLQSEQTPAFAYGDSAHDLPILRWARYGYLLSGRDNRVWERVAPERQPDPSSS